MERLKLKPKRPSVKSKRDAEAIPANIDPHSTETLTGKQDGFEAAVFRSADHFVVYRKLGHRAVPETNSVVLDADKHEWETFPQAATDAFYDDLALVYAVTALGRSALIPRHKWKEYLAVWEAMGGK